MDSSINRTFNNPVEARKSFRMSEVDGINTAINMAQTSQPDDLSKPDENKDNILDTLSLEEALKLANKKAKEGFFHAAKILYQDILEIFPKNKKASRDLKKLSAQITISAEHPQDPPQCHLLPLVDLYNNGELQKALEHTQLLSSSFPKSPLLLKMQGALLKASGQLDLAVDAYKKAVFIKPDYAEAYYNMGNAFKEQRNLEEAVIAYNEAISIQPNYAKAYYNMGNVLREQGKLELAGWAYKKTILIQPDFVGAYNNLGLVLQDQGVFAKAQETFTKAISIRPDFAVAHRHLSKFRKYTAEDAQFNNCKIIYANADLSDHDKCHLDFALAKMFEDTGDFDQAYSHLISGNSIRKKELGYSYKLDELLFERLSNWQCKIINMLPAELGYNAEIVPVFIVGMPRSGTTLIEQIVSSHSEVTGGGELDFVKQFSSNISVSSKKECTIAVAKFRTRYLNQLKKLSQGVPYVTDKMPINFRYIGLICATFPEAKIIHVQRDARAICWSNFKHYFNSKDYGYCYGLKDTVQYYKLYVNLMQHWCKKYKNRIYELDYDKLTENQFIETKRVIEYLGLNWEEACLKPHRNKRSVKTASNLQVRRNVYKGSSDAWRKYETLLDGAFDVLL